MSVRWLTVGGWVGTLNPMNVYHETSDGRRVPGPPPLRDGVAFRVARRFPWLAPLAVAILVAVVGGLVGGLMLWTFAGGAGVVTACAVGLCALLMIVAIAVG